MVEMKMSRDGDPRPGKGFQNQWLSGTPLTSVYHSGRLKSKEYEVGKEKHIYDNVRLFTSPWLA